MKSESKNLRSILTHFPQTLSNLEYIFENFKAARICGINYWKLRQLYKGMKAIEAAAEVVGYRDISYYNLSVEIAMGFHESTSDDTPREELEG